MSSQTRAAGMAATRGRVLVVVFGAVLGVPAWGAAEAGDAPAATAPSNAGVVRGVPGSVRPGMPSTPYQPARAQHEVMLFKGEVRVLDVPGTIKRVAVGDGALVSSTVVDKKLVLLAEKPGVTSLVIWNESGVAVQTRLRVTDQDLGDAAEQLRATLSTFVRQLEVTSRGNSIVLRGFVHPDRKDDLKAVIDRYKMVTNLIRPEDGGPLKKAVHFKVQIMEITKTGMENIGIAWDKQINGPQASAAGNLVNTGRYRTPPVLNGSPYDSVPGSVGGAASGLFLGVATSIFSKINLAISRGDAYVLAAPELNTRSGGSANFLAGGEVPIPIAGAFGAQTVIYKQYGIKLEVKPAVDGDNVITTSLGTEISQIDPSVSFGGYPAFLTRRTSSELTLRPGETIAISGLVTSQASNAIDKVPLLGDVPVLGQLFKSTNFRNNKSDLVIFVTPLIYDPNAPANENLMERAQGIERNYRYENGDPSPLPEIDQRREKEIDDSATRARLLEPVRGVDRLYQGG
ncbi:type II and III secretion system protein family protein [Cupriavidus basilensis]|uniref:type II and III secretion system protein family protein n=1 Tax=Cupriavidus basilensis TaxID=68895 RepID=UPI001ED93D01|nr:pilus assembly protein N-terminal domain-containing protein [Cupriavidus basilensis]